MSIPTLVLLKDGRELTKMVGEKPESVLREWILAAIEESEQLDIKLYG